MKPARRKAAVTAGPPRIRGRRAQASLRGNRIQGFTLIEIIVVVLVFSIMAAMAYGGLNAVLKTRVGIESALNRNAAMQRAYFRLRNDFQNLRNRPVRDAFGDVQPALSTDRDGHVTLTRGGWRNPLLLPRASFERVSYRLEDRKLLRSSWRVLDQAQDSKPVELAILDQVLESKWRFLDSEDEWIETWPKNTQSAEDSGDAPPPRAVELTLTTEDWGELKFLFEAGVLAQEIDFNAGPPSGLPGGTPDPGEGAGEEGTPPGDDGSSPGDGSGQEDPVQDPGELTGEQVDADVNDLQ